MKDPLNPGPVKAIEQRDVAPTVREDTRPFWLRLLASIRPTISREKIVRTGKTETEIGIKGHVDFCLLIGCVVLLSGCTLGPAPVRSHNQSVAQLHRELKDDGWSFWERNPWIPFSVVFEGFREAE